ncbi:MAG TPA: hypothetical protein VKU02_24910 [Gemmataceae bacterium]|nr:hypothetical protein [Gemmataceae bacterium]
MSLLGLAGSASAGLAARWLSPLLLGVSVLLLGRSFYILYVHRRGNRTSTRLTWLAAAFVAGFWTWRLV